MQTSQDAVLVLRLSQVQIGLMVKQELNAGECEREIFFGTSYIKLGGKRKILISTLHLYCSALKPRYFECDIDEILFELIIYSLVSTSNKKKC